MSVAELLSYPEMFQYSNSTTTLSYNAVLTHSLDPIFTIKHDSFFILSVSAEELIANKGLLFKVKDYDKMVSNDELGTVTVPAQSILGANGERLEFKLTPPYGKEEKNAVSFGFS